MGRVWLCSLFLASTAAAQDWPQLGNNAERWNYSAQRVEPPYKIRWTVRLTDLHPKHRIYCSAQMIVGDGRTYIGDKSGKLWAFDAGTGQISWTWQAGAEILHSAAYAALPDGTKTVFVSAMDGRVTALNSATGARRWEHATGRRHGFSAALLWDGTRLLAVDRGGVLSALNPADGRVLWTYAAGAPVGMSPAASNGRVVFASEDMKVHAVDAATGTRAWLAGPIPGRGFNDSYPVITRGRVFLRPRSGLEVQLVEGNASPVPGVSVLDEITGSTLPAPEHYHMAGWCGPVAPPAITGDGNLVHATKLLPGNWLVSGFALVDSVKYTIFDRLIGPKVNNYDTGIGAPDEAQVVSVHGDMIFQLNNQGVFWGNPPNEQNGAWDPVTRTWHIANSGLPNPPRQGEGDIGNIQQGGSNAVAGAGGLLFHHTWDLVYCWEGSTATPNRPPSVSISTPASGASFGAPASIRIEASASDPDGAVSRVDFLSDGVLIGSASAAPWTITWTGVPPGTYVLTAQARDNNGALATSTGVTVTVTGVSNQPPSVSHSAPADGATFTAPANLLLEAVASDPDGSVSRVEFLVNGTVVGSAAAPPWTRAWTNVPAGSYLLTARATDDQGATTTSAAVRITVTTVPPPPPPQVPAVLGFTLIDAWTDLPLGALLNGDVIDLSLLASRDLNVRADLGPLAAGSVSFEYDGNPDYRIENTAPHALAGRAGTDYFAWTPSLGAHFLAAVPYADADAGGAAGTRHVITFTVIDSNPGPAPGPAAGRDGANGNHEINDKCSGSVCVDPAASFVTGMLLIVLCLLVRL